MQIQDQYTKNELYILFTNNEQFKMKLRRISFTTEWARIKYFGTKLTKMCKACIMKFIKCCWEKLKEDLTNGKSSHVYGLEDC